MENHQPDKTRQGAQVAGAETAGFLEDAVKPLEAAALHPARGLRDATGVEIKGSADADEVQKAIADGLLPAPPQ